MVEIDLGYRLEGYEGYWTARKWHGTWKLVTETDNGYREIPFPSKKSMIEFMKEHNAKYIRYNVETEEEIVEDITESDLMSKLGKR